MKKLALIAIFTLSISLLAACGSTTSTTSSGGGNAITMGANTFSSNAITIKKGDTITFTDDPATGSTHDLVNGTNGAYKAEAGAPDFGGSDGKDLKPGDKWTSPAWNTPGTYHITCTVHPTTMNLTVTVTS